jgi:hypothetical protein
MRVKFNSIYRPVFMFLFMWQSQAFSQNQTISGYVVDKGNRETIIGATVAVKGTMKGASTDINGYFQITGLSEGRVVLVVSHVSYQSVEKIVELGGKSIYLGELSMEPGLTSIDEISVVGIRPDLVGDKEIETSQMQLTPKAIESIPTARNDVFRAIKYLPGIEGTEAFSPLYSVRGGDPGENKVVLDGVTIYNPYHFTTASGIFNVQTIKNIDIFVGGYGAEFGGSNSSILHITTKEGDKNELHGEFFPSLMQSKLLLEFPAGKDASIMLGGRYFYDIQSAFIFYNNSYFYDFNFSYSNRINNKNWLGVKVFASKDKTTYDFGRFYGLMGNSFDMDIYEHIDMGLDNHWNNLAATVYLKKILTPSIYMNTQLYYSSHRSSNYSFMDMVVEIEEEEGPYDVKLYYNTRFRSQIHDYSAKSDINIKLGMHHTLQAGIEHNWYEFENSAAINDIDKGTERREPLSLAAFFEDKIKYGPLIVRPGIRYTQYSFNDGVYWEPRANLSLNLSKKTRVLMAYGTYYQYIISMNTMEYEVNQFLDYYYPLGNIDPSKSIHYIAGFEHEVLKNQLTLKTDLYFKDIQRTYTFDLTQSEAETFTFSDKLQMGTGRAYGVETMLKGTVDKFSGWVSYGLSFADRSFPHIMDGKAYPFEYNRTHSFNLLLNYQVNPKLAYSTAALVMSGQPRTIETFFQNHYYYDPQSGNLSFFPIYAASAKNNARLPMVMEWDIGVKKRLRTGFGAELEEFFKADESYVNITIGNILFFRRNVSWYFPTGGGKYLPIGFNYIPYVNAGYILKF